MQVAFVSLLLAAVARQALAAIYVREVIIALLIFFLYGELDN